MIRRQGGQELRVRGSGIEAYMRREKRQNALGDGGSRIRGGIGVGG